MELTERAKEKQAGESIDISICGSTEVNISYSITTEERMRKIDRDACDDNGDLTSTGGVYKKLRRYLGERACLCKRMDSYSTFWKR